MRECGHITASKPLTLARSYSDGWHYYNNVSNARRSSDAPSRSLRRAVGHRRHPVRAWTYPAVKEILTPEQFEDPSCRMIYQAILDEHEAGEVSPADRGRTTGAQRHFAGCRRVPQARSDGAGRHPGNAVQSARVVRRQAQRAALGRVGARLQEAAEKGSVTPADLARLAVNYLQPLTKGADDPVRLLMDVTALDARHQAQRWAVKGVVPSNAVGMIFGASGAFKSFIALDYALHRAYGMTWCGRRTAKGTPIYIAAEGARGLSSESRHGISCTAWTGASVRCGSLSYRWL